MASDNDAPGEIHPAMHSVADDLWGRTLSKIETVVGRLVYLAGLRDPNSGRYEHHGLVLVFGDEEAGRALRESHEKVFAGWLEFDLMRQKADLGLYFAECATRKRTAVEAWLLLQPYRNLIPACASEAERRLFLSDFAVLLELFRRECGVAARDPNA
ncbi:MAG: hypothetical protein HY822_21880 [Acidobacteria bacterium]|nr:hypothetical protein [Acidobacteriota bacterium]